jgi:UDPglucose 6-dehydrogenase
MSKPIIGFCGLTHLGICSASASLSKGFKTICYDPDKELVENLKMDVLLIEEPFVKDVLFQNKSLLNLTSNPQDLKKCDLIYISLDVKTNDIGQSDLKELRKIIDTTSKHINQNSVLVILSQVPPGFTESLYKKFKKVYYQVETLIFGQAFDRAINPERFILGCKDPKVTIEKTLLYFLNAFECPIIKMGYKSAELCKISINMCLISSITTANKMAEICENIGADWNEIKPALKLDKRIGQYSYIDAQLGLSGGNLERDITSTINIAKSFNLNSELMESFFQISSQRKNWVFDTVNKFAFPKLKNPKIAILGLSYKANTNSIKNAPSLLLLNQLKGKELTSFDPVVNVKDLVPWCEQAKSPEEAISNADIIIVLTPWSEILEMNLKSLNTLIQNKFFIDPFNVFDKERITSLGFNYYSIGNLLE